MKWLKFDDVEHQGNGRYAIDWDAQEQKYKLVMRNVRVYEAGRIEVLSNGSRDPSWREEIAHKLGLDFSLMSDLSFKKFYMPDGRRVLRKEVCNKWAVFFYTPELSRVYAVNAWGEDSGITFLSEHAQPSPNAVFDVRVENREREKESLASYEEYFALGDTLIGVGARAAHVGNLSYYVRAVLNGEQARPTDFHAPDTQQFCLAIAKFRGTATRLIKDAARDKLSPKYLIVK